jgi:hypothetical protein
LFSQTNFWQTDLFLGEVEFRLDSVVLTEKKPFDFIFPMNKGYYESDVRVVLTALNYSQKDEATEVKWKKLEKSFTELYEDNKESHFQNMRKHPLVAEYYNKIEECKNSEPKLFELMKVLETKITEKQNETLWTKMTDWGNDLHNIDHGVKIGADKRLTELFCDCVLTYAKSFTNNDQKFIYELLTTTEKKYHKSSISKFLDKIEMDNSRFNYSFFKDQRIYLPDKLNGNSLPKELRKEVLASFFS